MIRYRLGTYLNEIHICDVMPSKGTTCFGAFLTAVWA